MAVKIELLNRYQLRIKSNDTLLLPIIEIKPTDSFNFPHISKIDISVSGKPEDMAAKIQSVYRSVSFSNKLLKLSTPQRLKQIDCTWDEPLPAGVNCTLLVTVEYFDSDETGNPNLSLSKNSTSECNIWTYAGIEDTVIQMSVRDTLPLPLPGPFYKPEPVQESKKPEIS